MMMLSLTTLFSLMMLPVLCVLVASFIVGLFERNDATLVQEDQMLIEADML
jgi:hypothetical protein